MTDTIDKTDETTEEQPALALVGVDDEDTTEAAEAEDATEATAEPQTETSGQDKPENVTVGPRMSAADEGHLFELRDKLRRREEREAEAHEAHKEAKKATEAAQKELNEYIDELEQGQGNLFRGPRPEVKADAPATVKESLTPAADAQPEAWRDEPVSVLEAHGVKARAVKALAEKVPPIATLGQLSDYMGGQWSKLTDIAGIGNVAAENIEAALTSWFIANPDKCPPVKSAEAAQPAKTAPGGKLEWTTPHIEDGRVIHHAMPQPGTNYTIEEKGGLYVLDDGFSESDHETLAAAKKFANELEAERQSEAAKLAAENGDTDESDDTE